MVKAWVELATPTRRRLSGHALDEHRDLVLRAARGVLKKSPPVGGPSVEDFHMPPERTRQSARLPTVDQREQTGRGSRCGLPLADMLLSDRAGAIKLSDPYINEITGLEIPEHDRVASDFGPTRDKRVSDVYCLFQNRGEKLRGRDHSALPWWCAR